MKAAGRTEYEPLGRVIAEVREEKRMSQRDLADRARRHQPAIAKIEKGAQGLDIVEFLDIADAFGMPPEELFQRFVKAIQERHSTN